MCRNIKILFNFEPPVTEEEVRAASLQFVRKVSGFNKPSKANEAAFLAAVDAIAAVSSNLLSSLETAAIASTAARNAASLAFDGLLKPLTLRTNCNEAARISSSVTGGSKLKRVCLCVQLLCPLACAL